MNRIVATLLATIMLAGAGPALAASNSADSAASTICENPFAWGDTNKDDQLSRAEIEKMRDANYGAIDANNDGEISKQEYVECLGDTGKTARDEAATGQSEGTYKTGKWSDITTTDDAREMTDEDWADLAQEAWESGDAEMQEAVSYGGSKAETSEEFARAATQRFQMHDQNGDGVITEAEYEARAEDMKFDDTALEARFEELDTDDSGAVSPQEYRGAAAWAEPTGADTTGEGTSDVGDGFLVPVYHYYIRIL